MNVGVIGLGIMGSAAVQKLLSSGYQVHIYNRSKDKAEPFVQNGATLHNSPADLARSCDLVISFVMNADALKQISFGSDGVIHGLPDDAVHCDMSTITPEEAHTIAEQYKSAGKRYVQAPVLGSKKQIAEGSLLVFAGGNKDDIEKCRTVWSAIAKSIWEFDRPSQSAALKLSFNILIASMIGGLGQSIALAGTAGINITDFLDILAQSALNAPMYQSKGKTIAENNFDANFYVRNLLKDVKLASETASACGVTLPINNLMQSLLEKAVDSGYGDEDYSAVVKVMM